MAGVGAARRLRDGDDADKGDPFESYNRTMFTINDKIDQYALKPVAKGYVWAVPEPVRNSVTNFFSNIGDVYIAANNLLQLKIADGVSDIMRVAINTVFGVGGLFDVATLAKLPKHDADFGLTLGHYGMPSGPYVVLPLLGPSTVRDTGGAVVDYLRQSAHLHQAGFGELGAVRRESRRCARESAGRERRAFRCRARQIFVRAQRILAASPVSDHRRRRARRRITAKRRLPNYDDDAAGAGGRMRRRRLGWRRLRHRRRRRQRRRGSASGTAEAPRRQRAATRCRAIRWCRRGSRLSVDPLALIRRANAR